MGGGASSQRQEAITDKYSKATAQEAQSQGIEFFHHFSALRNGSGTGSSDVASDSVDTAIALSDMLTTAVGGAIALTELANVSAATIQVSSSGVYTCKSVVNYLKHGNFVGPSRPWEGPSFGWVSDGRTVDVLRQMQSHGCEQSSSAVSDKDNFGSWPVGVYSSAAAAGGSGLQ